jgi:opacity protein-like surface antigen
MKKLGIGLILLLAVSVAFSTAQTAAGKRFELGTSISYYNIKFDDDPEGSISYLNIPVRFGFYIWNGLEFEPEFQLFVPMGDDGGDTTYFVTGKLLYNFELGGGFVPLLGGGAGIGNGIPFLGIIEGGSDTKSFAFFGLAGFKYMIGNSAALRVEYRFNRISWEYPDFIDPEVTYKEWANLHNVLVGVSLFF